MRENLSVGILYSCHEFLRYVDEEHLAAKDLIEFFDRFYVAKSSYVLELSQQCSWILVAQDGSIEVTPSGTEISLKTPEHALRDQIRDYILCVRPPWSGLLPRGREEAVLYFSDDVRQCFDEADLLAECDDEVVQWWDNLSSAARGRRNDSLAEIGRQGEKLSLQYELRRTNTAPTWMAIESNLAGFDIQSIVSELDSNALFIEVKASERKLDSAQIFISKNEWRVARTTENFVFHVWVDVYSEERLFVVTTEAIGRHIPKDAGDGDWRNVKIPARSLVKENEMVRLANP